MGQICSLFGGTLAKFAHAGVAADWDTKKALSRGRKDASLAHERLGAAEPQPKKRRRLARVAQPSFVNLCDLRVFASLRLKIQAGENAETPRRRGRVGLFS